MTQDEINQAEWSNPANWHGGWLPIYRSARDSRAWVPKPDPRMGTTVNLAHASGVLTILFILALGLTVAAVAVYFTR